MSIQKKASIYQFGRAAKCVRLENKNKKIESVSEDTRISHPNTTDLQLDNRAFAPMTSWQTAGPRSVRRAGTRTRCCFCTRLKFPFTNQPFPESLLHIFSVNSTLPLWNGSTRRSYQRHHQWWTAIHRALILILVLVFLLRRPHSGCFCSSPRRPHKVCK